MFKQFEHLSPDLHSFMFFLKKTNHPSVYPDEIAMRGMWDGGRVTRTRWMTETLGSGRGQRGVATTTAAYSYLGSEGDPDVVPQGPYASL